MTHYCLQCDDGTKLVHTRRDLTVQVRGRERVVTKVLGWHCPVCGEVEFDAGEGRRYSEAVEALAAEVAAEEAAMLRSVRKRLGLSQKAAAELTGGGHNAFSRYERGEVRPMAAVINLFNLLDRHPELLGELAEAPSRTNES
jgi:HTH-type transcriptional regulator/antitoxin MqsA